MERGVLTDFGCDSGDRTPNEILEAPSNARKKTLLLLLMMMMMSAMLLHNNSIDGCVTTAGVVEVRARREE